MKCFNSGVLKVDCIIDAEGIIDYMFELNLADPATFNATQEIITSAIKKGEFEMPPMFEIARIDRADKYIGFLLRKTSLNQNSASRLL